MSIGSLLRRAGASSPLLPAGVYTGALTIGNLAVLLAPSSPAAAAVALLLWLAGLLFLGVVVPWYRDDDWLAAGVLLGLTVLVGGLVANLIAAVIAYRSLGPAIVAAAGASLGLLVQAVILVPLSGAAVWMARWTTRRLKRRSGTPASPPA